MRKQRTTESEYLQAKIDVENIKQKISLLRAEKKKLVDKIRWYEYTEKDIREDYATGVAAQMFGKRFKNLTEEEKRAYQRENTRRSRENKKCNKE